MTAPEPATAPLADRDAEPPKARRKRRRGVGSLWAWLIFLAGCVYFLVPLISTLEYSLRPRPFGLAYAGTLADP